MSTISTLTLTQAPVAMAPVATPPSRSAPTSTGSSPVGTLPPAEATVVVPPHVSPRQQFPSVTLPAPAAPISSTPVALPPADATLSTPPAAPPLTRKVARLVTADSAQSTFKLAADGQLPHLQLQEADSKEKSQGKSRSIPPLVMIGAWVLSVAFTVAIVMISSDNDDPSFTSQTKSDAMRAIEKDFFGNPERGELLPYQFLLREARQARAGGDYKAERHFYQQVLKLLHTETWDGSASASQARLGKGITGSTRNDRELEKLILIVMGD